MAAPFPNTERKFLSLIKKTKRCWKWIGAKDKNGYGLFSWSKGFYTKRAPRVAFHIFVKRIPKGKHVLHRCDNPECVNPKHLFFGSARDNVKDMFRKGRNKSFQACQTHCVNGHAFDKQNTGIRKNGNRYCKKCVKFRKLKYKQKEFL